MRRTMLNGKYFSLEKSPETGLIPKVWCDALPNGEKMNPNIIIRNARLHNLYLVKAADWVINLGPEGDQLLAEGTPEDVAKVEESYTGQCLKGVL